MEIDRALVLRGLNLVSVAGINYIIIRKDGKVCHANEDQTVFVYGDLETGVLDEDWALPDIGLFSRMLRKFQSSKVSLRRERNSFKMIADGIQWMYRLGSIDHLSTIDNESADKLIACHKKSIPVSIDVLKKLAEIQSVVKAKSIHFIAKAGTFKFVVGESDTYAGTIEASVGVDVDFDLKVPSDRLMEIIDKIDTSAITLRFATEAGVKAICVDMGLFKWVVGATLETN